MAIKALQWGTPEMDVLRDLNAWGSWWVRPMDIGGHSHSKHSRILTKLVRRGLVERRRRFTTPPSGSYRYRVTPEGSALSASRA
jgi:hypothetical protein